MESLNSSKLKKIEKLKSFEIDDILDWSEVHERYHMAKLESYDDPDLEDTGSDSDLE
jgi:hypothetical protein